MSATGTTCIRVTSDVDIGAGEVKCYKIFSAGCSFSNMMASELVQEILNNALDIADSTEIKPIFVEKVPKISKNVVGDIIENILSNKNQDSQQRGGQNDPHNETSLLDEEIKRIIKEMKLPSDHAKMSTNINKGIGDQLTCKSEIASEKPAEHSSRRNTLERKCRLTNLVRNSKHMLSKIITNSRDNLDSSNRPTSSSDPNIVQQPRDEESEEKCIRTINFDSSSVEDCAVANNTGTNSGSTASDCQDREDGENTNSEEDTSFQKFDEDCSSPMDDVDLAHGEGNSRLNTLKKEKSKTLDGEKDAGSAKKKNKWNIGTKLMKYLKKKKEAKQSTSG